jgi:CheY-like chemotaxis protein
MRRLLLQALEERGYHIETCEDGRSAFHCLTRNSYDLVITDHSMPRMTGLELIQSHRSAGGRIPIILMTSTRPEELANPEHPFDGVTYLRKPFGLTELHRAVRKALRARKG